MTRPTQTTRVLRMLEAAGAAGLTQLDVIVHPPDHGPPILALSQRIGELRHAGHRINVERARTPDGTHVARYRLVRSEPERRPAGRHAGHPRDTDRPEVPGTPRDSRDSDPGRPATVALPLGAPAAPDGPREGIFDIDETHNPDRASFRAHNPPRGRANDYGAQPEEEPLVHNRTSRPGHRA